MRLDEPSASPGDANSETELTLIKGTISSDVGIFHGEAARAKTCDHETDVTAFAPLVVI